MALVAAVLIAALGLTRPAAADGWGGYPPPGFAPPPSVSLFSGNAPSAFYPAPPRRRCVSPKRVFGYGRPAYTYAPGYGSPRYGRSHKRGGGNRTLIIVTR
jgi:hypothetical protein